jgi:hypothetical protein
MKTVARHSSVIFICALLLAGCATASHKWEYRTRTTDNPKGKSVLDGYGKDGWELVDYTVRPKDASGTNFIYQYVFKRERK